MSRQTQSWWVPALVGLLFLLLPVLATLQVRWIDALSDSETERLAHFVTTGVNRIAADLDRQLIDVESMVRGVEIPSPEPVGPGLARRWREDTPRSSLVAGLLLIDPDAPQTPQVVHPDGTVSPTEWSPEWGAWSEVAAKLSADHASSQSIVLPTQPPGLLIPLRSRDPASPGPSLFALARLDADRLQREVLPGLVERHLGQPFGAPVEVLITRGGEALYPSNGEWMDPQDADARARLGGSQIEIGDAGEGGRQVVLRRGREGEPGAVVEVDQRAVGPRSPPGDRFQRMIQSPEWEIRARHAAGSVALAVASSRRRNLALGLGTLGILALTAGLLLLAARRSRRVARQQMEFVAGVTHELRTPLTVIRSAAENLVDGVVTTPEKTRHYGQLIHDEERRLSELVEGALALAGATNHKTVVLPRAIDLRAFLPEVVERCWRGSRCEGAPDLEVPAQTPLVLADPPALERALANLLGNAVKYGGSPRQVGVRVSSHDAATVDITVWDRGPGIPPEEQVHLFEPFFRGRTAREAQLPGSGLGLSVVRRAMEAVGGSVSVRSQPGQGSAFVLHLPVAPA